MKLPEQTYQKLINYLAARPWREVAQLMGELAQAQEATDSQEPSGEAVDKKSTGGSRK